MGMGVSAVTARHVRLVRLPKIQKELEVPVTKPPSPPVSAKPFPPRALKLLQIAANPESAWEDAQGESLTSDAAEALAWIAAHSETQPAVPALVDVLRGKGLTVAVHNDYRLRGKPHTFWLMTAANGMSYKGEGLTDAEALKKISEQFSPPPAAELPEKCGACARRCSGCPKSRPRDTREQSS